MSNTKKRRDVEIYENYWKFTAAHLDITGTKFNNCLNIIVLFMIKTELLWKRMRKAAMIFLIQSFIKSYNSRLYIFPDSKERMRLFLQGRSSISS